LDAPLATPTDLKPNATKDIAGAMNAIMAGVFALDLKTKISTGISVARISAIII
jgi:starvation-inducible DNA-binding protein